MSADGDGGGILSQNADLSIYIFVLVLLILVGCFFGMAKAAIIGINDKKISKLSEEGNKNAKILKKMLKKPTRFLHSINLCICASTLAASAYGAYKIGEIYVPNPLIQTAAFVVTTIILIILVSIFCQALPKGMGDSYADKLAMLFAKPMMLFYWFLYPFVGIISAVSKLILRIFGIDPDAQAEQVTEEEIRLMVDVGEEKGVIPETEKVMINNIFEFNDITVNKIMTHRTDIVAIPRDAQFNEIVKVSADEGYTRLPVYDNTLDNIVGILHTKSLIEHMGSKDGEEFKINDYMIKPIYIPRSKMANDLFDEMQKKKIHIAVVVDEYGGTAGIVTMEDLIESILGNIQDEYDDEETEITKLDENTYVILGNAELTIVSDETGMQLPDDLEVGFDYDTLGGFATGMLDKIPENGDRFEFDNVEFEIIDADDKKINKVKVTVKPRSEDDEEEE